ncbi:conjugal transfer protein TraG N-terminal domain-containing protein [Aliarcobacter butzleri]
MKKILFLLFFSINLFAEDGWWIYSYEDVSTLKAVFNYLAMIKTDQGYLGTINVVLIVGLAFTIIMKFLDLMAIPKYILSVIGIMLVSFSLNTTIHIINVKSYNSFNPNIKNYATVDNVPFIFSVLSSAFSSVGYNSALLIETIFTTIVDDDRTMEASFLKTGTNGAFKILEVLDSINPLILNSDAKSFNQSYKEYLKLCIFDIAYAIDYSLQDNLFNEPNIFEAINPSNNQRYASISNIASQKVIDQEGTIVTCSNLYSRANNFYEKIKNQPTIANTAKSLISNVTANEEAASIVVKMMTQSNITDTQANITNYILNNGIKNAFLSSIDSYGIGTSSAQAGFGAGLAEAQYQAQGKIKAKAATIMIPTMHTVLQALFYVLFPFIIIVQLFSGGFKILQNYILGLLWLEFWVPSFSVLSYFSLKEAQTQAFDKLVSSGINEGPNGMLTIANSNEIYNTIANQAASAADMYWMVPFIAGFMLYASFQSLSGITGSISGLVSQYSNNQTLEQERAKIAAFDSINSEMQKNDPLYTGNIGTVSAMTAQSSTLSHASKAAADFLGTNSSLNDFSKLSRSNMFSGLESSVGATTREQNLTGGGPLTGGLTPATENAAIKAGQDYQSAKNLQNQVDRLGLNENNIFRNSVNLENAKGNVAPTVAIDGKETKAIVGGGMSTSEYTSKGVIKESIDNNGKVVQSSTDGSRSENYSTTVNADNINTARKVNDTSSMINTSSTVNADNINTARKVNDTSSMINTSSTVNADNTSSAVNTNTYTDKDGIMYKEVLDGHGKAVGRTLTEYREDGLLTKEQKLNSEGAWDTIRSNLDGSFSSDHSKKTITSILEDNSYTKNNSITSDYTTENKGSAFKTMNELWRERAGATSEDQKAYYDKELSSEYKRYTDTLTQGPKNMINVIGSTLPETKESSLDMHYQMNKLGNALNNLWKSEGSKTQVEVIEIPKNPITSK